VAFSIGLGPIPYGMMVRFEPPISINLLYFS
ncbi:unnamed protein product, partial [Allacma fusca]